MDFFTKTQWEGNFFPNKSGHKTLFLIKKEKERDFLTKKHKLIKNSGIFRDTYAVCTPLIYLLGIFEIIGCNQPCDVEVFSGTPAVKQERIQKRSNTVRTGQSATSVFCLSELTVFDSFDCVQPVRPCSTV